jgi:hypothetical protein
MGDPIEGPVRPFRVVLDGGEAIESDGSMVQPPGWDQAVPELVWRMPVTRAHTLAHVLDDWSRALGIAPPKRLGAADRVLAQTLEAAAAALGEPAALRCTAREFGVVTGPQRLAAAAVLAERESRLSAVQRMAVVDAAARWLGEQSGDELAYALLAAVCANDVTTNKTYVALLARPDEPGPGGGDQQ